MSNEKILESDITHSVANARNLCVFSKHSDEIVISSAAEHSAVVFGRLIKDLEYRSRIIVKTADYTKVEYAILEKVGLLKHIKEREKLVCAY